MIQICISIQEPTHAAEVRRRALGIARELSFDEVSAGNVGLVVTEAATNILKHGRGGQMLLRSLAANSHNHGIEVLALDKGPGIADMTRCFEDGYSTAGSAGTGLGAIARLSDFHEIYSSRSHGTALLAQLWKNGRGAAPNGDGRRFRCGGISVPVHGEQECGDSWAFQEAQDYSRTTVADGLGHGPQAALASQAAIATAGERLAVPLPALLDQIHGALRSTRGAAVGVADIDPEKRVVRFAGVGNISALVMPESGSARHLVSSAGTAGHAVRKIQEFMYPWDSQSLLVLHSDGLQTHWSFDPYPGLRERHPSLIAGVLYRDYSRGRDDVTVVVVREANRKA